ncbi:5'-3' exonuclease [Paenisporosarcina cavernae]|uniref:5'-3' exonuclease n=2 Tax=Paenisporosarcina cavernae TaxID=2320858 RepID=A0A385YVU8_9BACL|nr:5'-3' exonuclease [Paenisporosarcina cavernae]
MALLFRSFFATAAFSQYFPNSKGIPTNAVQGFARHVMSAKQLMNPTHLAITWDMGARTFRNDLFDGYKANRPAPPEEMLPQFDMAKQVADLMDWTSFGVVGKEADDVIGSLACKFENEADMTIISGDKDLLQLLSPSTTIAFTKKGYTEYDVYTLQRFQEEYLLEPKQFADVKAFMGDSSDGYPGVKGIGPKSALQFIQNHGSIDGVLQNMASLKPGQRKKIEESLEMLKLSKELATIDCEVPLDVTLDALKVNDYTKKHIDALSEQEYRITLRHLQSLFPIK